MWCDPAMLAPVRAGIIASRRDGETACSLTCGNCTMTGTGAQLRLVGTKWAHALCGPTYYVGPRTMEAVANQESRLPGQLAGVLVPSPRMVTVVLSSSSSLRWRAQE